MPQTIHVESFAQWRDAARELLQQQVPPHAVQWMETVEASDLFGNDVDEGLAATAAVAPFASSITASPVVRLPRQLMNMLQTACCFRAADRWAFLYKVVWRWQQGEHDVMSAADSDGQRLHGMVKAVHREEHDMRAYLRFRERREEEGAPRFVAWYEPVHDVLPQIAEYFAQRMGKTSWMIGTPDATVFWDGTSMHMTGPLLRGPADIEDAGEALWLTYYQSIFNPSRLNMSVMNSHIPARFWKNLPEGKVVPALVSNAAVGARRIGQFQAVGARDGVIIPIHPERAQPQRELPSTLDQCRRCELWEHATQAVPGVGPSHASIMLLGEQPGDQEDLEGQPFVGPAGQLLDRVLEQAQLDRQSLYLTNAVKHFKWEPRGKRRLHKTPGQREINACAHWLEHEMRDVQPKVVVALGSTALKALLHGSKVGLTDMLNKPFMHEGRWIVTVYHPSYVLRLPDENAKAHAFSVMVKGLQQAQQLAQIA